MLGSASTPRNARSGEISNGRTGAPFVRRVTWTAPRWITRPSRARTRAGTSGATRSISLFWSASPAVKERLLSTASSASWGLRPLRTASERMLAAESSSTFLAIVPWMSPPSPSTGWAAPALVPGAMAATSADIRMKNPAEPARAPLGAT